MSAFDLQAYLRAQKELAEANLEMTRNAQAQLGRSQEETGKSARESYSFLILVVAGLVVAAGFLVIWPTPPPSAEALTLRAEVQRLKSEDETKTKHATAQLEVMQKELIATQEALRAANAELVRTQEALRAAQGKPGH